MALRARVELQADVSRALVNAPGALADVPLSVRLDSDTLRGTDCVVIVTDHEKIDWARLEAKPEARLCIKCKQRKSFGR